MVTRPPPRGAHDARLSLGDTGHGFPHPPQQRIARRQGLLAARDDVVEQGNRVAQPPGGVVPAGQLGLAGQVEFCGSVPQARLPVYYASAEACLMPSYSESFGLVGLEAQACASPVVASHQAGVASVVRDGVTGFLVDGPDPAAYADRMLRLLEEPGLSHRMGERAARLVGGLSWQRSADRLLNRFEQLVEQRQHRQPRGPALIGRLIP